MSFPPFTQLPLHCKSVEFCFVGKVFRGEQARGWRLWAGGKRNKTRTDNLPCIRSGLKSPACSLRGMIHSVAAEGRAKLMIVFFTLVVLMSDLLWLPRVLLMSVIVPVMAVSLVLDHSEELLAFDAEIDSAADGRPMAQGVA